MHVRCAVSSVLPCGCFCCDCHHMTGPIHKYRSSELTLCVQKYVSTYPPACHFECPLPCNGKFHGGLSPTVDVNMKHDASMVSSIVNDSKVGFTTHLSASVLKNLLDSFLFHSLLLLTNFHIKASKQTNTWSSTPTRDAERTHGHGRSNVGRL